MAITDESRQLLSNQRLLEKKLTLLTEEVERLKQRSVAAPPAPAPVKLEPPKVQKILITEALATGVAFGIGFAIAAVIIGVVAGLILGAMGLGGL